LSNPNVSASINNKDRQEVVVVDATDHIAGRLCSYIAKLLLSGKRVVVVNAERAMISGKKESILREWHEFLQISSVVHPKHGPFHPRRPDMILRRMVRGMLPRKKPKGINAFKRLRVYIGVPEDYANSQYTRFDDAMIRKQRSYYTSIEEVARSIGWGGGT
jgi:large subunit ribosomal protein L13